MPHHITPHHMTCVQITSENCPLAWEPWSPPWSCPPVWSHLWPLTCLFSLSWLSRVCRSVSILLYSLWTVCRLLAESWNCFWSISITFMVEALIRALQNIYRNKSANIEVCGIFRKFCLTCHVALNNIVFKWERQTLVFRCHYNSQFSKCS